MKNNKEDVLALRISVGIIILSVIIGATALVKNTLYDNEIQTLIDNTPDEMVVLPSGVQYLRDDSLNKTILNIVKSNDYSKKEKREIIEVLALQGIDTTDFVEAYNTLDWLGMSKPETVETANKDKNSNINEDYEIKDKTPVINFLESSGLVSEVERLDVEDRGETGLNMLGGKSAKSYKNLYEAEKGFGTRLGLFFNVTALPNYEMVAAYTIGDEFLQCVYAINRDGTALRDGQDIEESEINTLTVKLSMTKTSSELKKVYKDYELLFTEEMSDVEPTMVDFYGSDENTINMICLDMENGRSYCIHCANGIEKTQAMSLVLELIDNIQIVDLIVYEEPDYD